MKRLFLFLAFLPLFTLSAQSEAGLIDQANAFYKQEKYVEAIAMYDSVLTTGFCSSELYYNLGNSLYKTGQIAPCILNYERALQLSPNDEDILYNLELVQQHVVDKIEMMDVFFLKKMIHEMRSKQSSNVWAMLSLGAFGVMLLTFLFFFLSSSVVLKRLGFYLGILSLLTAILSLSFSIKGKQDIVAKDTAIVFAPTVTVNSSPNVSGTKLFVLHEGAKVQIVDELGEWVEIKLSDGNKGWLKTEAIEVI